MTKLKSALLIAAIVTAAFITGLIVYANYQRTAYLNAKGAADVLTAEYESYKESADGLIAGLNAAINQAMSERDAAIADASMSHSAAAAIKDKYDLLQAQTAALPPDVLTGHIALRVGAGNISQTAGGLYILTRPGAEATLNRFLEGEGWRDRYEAKDHEATSLQTALSASMSETTAWRQKFTIKDGELLRAVAAWDTEHDALVHLRRSILGRQAKTCIIGAGVGAAAVLIYNAVKGK